MLMADAEDEDSVSVTGSDVKKTPESAIAPWVGYNEEETMKAQILALSKVVVTNFSSVIYLQFCDALQAFAGRTWTA